MVFYARNLTPYSILKLSAALLLTLNLILYFLRVVDSEWWVGDYAAYSDVDPVTHFQAIFYFCVYLGIYFLMLRKISPKNIQPIERRNTKALFYLVILFFSIQIYFAIFYAVGVAGSSGKAPVAAYFLFLFSFDGVYYIYALNEKNKNRLIVASLFYTIANIVRGWAGFIVFLVIIYFLRRGQIDKKRFILFATIFICLMPVLFVVRDVFRGGYSKFDSLKDSGLIGFQMYSEYFFEALKLILIRFDFYSNFIGVYRISNDSILNRMCNPIQENILFKFYSFFDSQFDCISLGSILPGSLYDFFLETGTSYSIASGFLALPGFSALAYLFQYLFILFCFSLFFKYRLAKLEYICFFVFLVFLLLFQGWMYQFIYNIAGFLVGWILLRTRLGFKNIN